MRGRTFTAVTKHNNEVCLLPGGLADMEFVQNFTPPDFQPKNFTSSISPNFNSFSKKKNTKNE